MDEDQVGLNALKGLYEAEDMANITYKPFVESKVKGNALTVLIRRKPF